MEEWFDGIAYVTTFRYRHEGDHLDCRSTSIGFILMSIFSPYLFSRDLVISQLTAVLTCYVPQTGFPI
ncbi:MAG: hypothetical protein IKK67_02135 [Bacteroidaceae bacterium]|nr:hypothetical protein [Bacteroidaceae bacterium]